MALYMPLALTQTDCVSVTLTSLWCTLGRLSFKRIWLLSPIQLILFGVYSYVAVGIIHEQLRHIELRPETMLLNNFRIYGATFLKV
jgi:hypothetical protein